MKSKHLLLTLLLALFVPWAAMAQDLADYTFSTGTDDTQWITLSDGLSSIVSSGDDNVSSLKDIGFSFSFGDGTYTKFWANSNGIFSFNDTPNNNWGVQFTSSYYTQYQPKICGITRDMCVPSNGGYVKYELTGTAPNRVLVCEFNLGATSSASSATVKWQVQLYEADAKVILVYGATASPSSFQIGLSQSGSDIWTVNPTTHEATHATGAVSTTYNAWPGENRYYQFERPVWTCFKPINLGVSALSTTSATLTWEESGDATNWVLQYGTDSQFNTCTEVNVSNTPSFNATVTAGDTYYFRVKPDCDTDGSKWSNPFEFTVPCEAIAALSFDKGNLDSYTGTSNSTPSANNLPDCWSYINNCTNSSYKYYPVIYSNSSYAHSTSNSLRFYSYGSSDPQPQYAILPNMSGLAGKQVTLQAKGYNANSTFKVGTMSNPTNVNTFNLITEQTGLTTSYQEFEYLIPSTCTDNYLVIMIDAAPSGYNGRGVYIDDIVITTPPTCTKPNGLDVTADGLNAIFTWESIESEWQVAYSTVATANPDDNIMATVDTKTYTSPDLTVNNDYYFWVRSYCSDSEQSDWVGPKAVHIGYCVPAPTSIDGSGISNVTFGKLPNTVNDNLSMTASPYYYDHSSQAGAAWLGNTVEIKINYATNYAYYTWVWVDWDNDLAFSDDEQVYAATSTISSGILTITFPVPATQALGNYRMRIQGADDSSKENPCYTSTYSYLVDYTLSVIEAPSCLPPTNLNVSRNGNIATATWEGDGVDYNIDINGTVTNNVTSPYQFTVELSTDYAVKVMANCEGDDTSGWTDPFNFSTPDCWGGHIIEYTLNDSYSGADGWTGSPISAILVKEGCGNVVETLTIENGLTTKSGTLTLCGDYYEFVWQAGQYPGECSFTFTEGGTTIFTKPSNATDGMVLYTIGTQSCPAPTNLTAGTPEARSVALTWNENGEATAWQICLNNDEENLIEVVENFTVTAGVVSYTLNGLTPDTDYTIKVRANCGEEQSCWSDEDIFSTIVACPVPTNLDVAEATTEEEKAVLTWVAGGTETAWNIQLATYNDANETWSEYEVIEENFNKTTYPIERLTAGTTYRVQVQAVCGGEFNDMSEWSDYFEFTTVASCVAPTNLAVTPDSETALGATITWEGTNDHYVVEYREAATLLNDDFEKYSSGLPTNWQKVGSGTVAISSYSTTHIHSGTKSMRFSGATSNVVALPEFGFEANQLKISFYTKAESGTNSSCGKFEVGYLTNVNDASTFVRVGEQLDYSDYGSYQPISNVSMAGAPDGARIAFRHLPTTTNWYWFVDDVVVERIVGDPWTVADNNVTVLTYTFETLNDETKYEARVKGVCVGSESQYSNVVSFTTLDACPAPTNFTLGEVTGNSAAFSWTQPTNGVEINEWVVKYRKSGETEYMTLTPNPTVTNATIEDLDANTEYEVVIAPACNEEKTLEDIFGTPCDEKVISLGSPYTYDFASSAEWDCWNNVAGTNDLNGGHLRLKGTTTGNIVALPEFDHEISDLMIVFWTRPEDKSYSSCGTFEVGYMTDLDDKTTFVTVLDKPYSYSDWKSNTYVRKTAVFTDAPTGAHIAFRQNASSSSYYWFVDDVTVGLPQNFSKEIAGYGAGNEQNRANWYLIASPVGEIDSIKVTNMTQGAFDLYYFDQSEDLEWINYEDTDDGGYGLYSGMGYLYANQDPTTITFTGVANLADSTVILSKTANTEFEGWNLVGNPFGVAAYIDRDFYRMNSETGAEVIPGSGAINVMEGVFVAATEDNEELIFRTKPVAAKASLALNLSRNSNVIDRAMVRFNDERTLPKFQINKNSTKVFITEEGKDYAVVNAESNVGEIPVSFKAEKNGSYNLSFTSQEVSFSYLHLIDNMTGEDVNLLVNPSYSFDARTTDYESRFRLVFATGSSATGDNFSFINTNGNLCIFGIEGEATVQVIDILGHVLSSETFSGSYEKKINGAPGVYMIRLVNGNDVKVQKVVVR